MTGIAFEKWEGLGNDFVLLAGSEPPDEVVRRLCDRRLGVGADGVLVVDEAGAAPRMIVRNADGSRPEMCGNGLRCVAAWLVGRRGRTDGELTVLTDAGERKCRVKKTERGWDVTIDMGVARLGAPLELDVAPALGETGPRVLRLATVDVGNPHAITWEPMDPATFDRVGPFVERAVPKGTNVELCRREGDFLHVVVWERGVGRTLACGTGACAVAAAACELDAALFDGPIRVRLPGGELAVTVARATRRLTMRGPARRVFEGAL